MDLILFWIYLDRYAIDIELKVNLISIDLNQSKSISHESNRENTTVTLLKSEISVRNIIN